MKSSALVLVAAALTLLVTTLLFKEASATCRQREMITDKEAAAGGLAGWQSLANAQPNPNVTKPPPPHISSNAQSSLEVTAAGSPGPICNPNVPTCSLSQPEKLLKVIGNAELKRNDQTSINAGKQASVDHTY